MASPLANAIESARGLMAQGYNPQAIMQQLQAQPRATGPNGKPIVANPMNSINQVQAGQWPGAPGKQYFGGAMTPKGVNPQLWHFLGRQEGANPNQGGVGGPVANPGGLVNNVPTYLNKHAPNAQGVETFRKPMPTTQPKTVNTPL